MPVQPSAQGFPWYVEYPGTSGHTEGVNDYPDSSGNVYRRIAFKNEAADDQDVVRLIELLERGWLCNRTGQRHEPFL